MDFEVKTEGVRGYWLMQYWWLIHYWLMHYWWLIHYWVMYHDVD